MPNFCLIKTDVEKVKKALRDGSIDPSKLADMSSADRRSYLEKFVGTENAKQVNSLFESKLLLKNQKAGYISWAKKLVGITPQVRQDMISKIERLDKVLDPQEGEQFLQDLAETKLGIGVTQNEAKDISDLSQKVSESKKVWEDKLKAKPEMPAKEWMTDPDRIQYGMDVVTLEEYVNDLKLKSKEISFRREPARAIANTIADSPGIFKSLLSSLDNSFWGRQGIKALLDPKTAPIWTKDFLKSWGDIGRELAGKDALKLIKADIYSRPNAMNGKYKAGGYGLDALTEEAFPSALPEKIPGLRRLWKASESAYNGGALRLRADLADRLIPLAEKNGINTSSPEEAKPLGHLIGSLTGRGNLGSFETVSKPINNIFFSIKFLLANFDTVTAPFNHAFRKTAGPFFGKGFKNKGEEFASKEAAESTLRIVATLASILTLGRLKYSVDGQTSVVVWLHWLR